MPDYTLPVDSEDISNLPRIRVTPALPVDLPVDPMTGNPIYADSSQAAVAPDWMQKLTGTGNVATDDRYITWPEKMLRSGLALPADVYEGRTPITDESGHTSQSVIERAQDLAGLVTTGGIVGTPKGALGSSGSKLFDTHKQKMMEKYGNNDHWVSKQTDEEFAQMNNAFETDKNTIQLENGKKLVPVKHNPFAELEEGIADTIKSLPRERRTNPNIIEDVPTKEVDKIHDIAMSFVDRWNPKAREKRAEAQGFEQDAYHGTKGEFTSLNVMAPKGYGFYSTPNSELANMYAGKPNPYREPSVIPLKINTKEYDIVDAGGKNWTEINDKAIAKAQKEGKKGVVIHNVYDEPASGAELGSPKTVFISLDPTTVKSKFAKFNLEKLGLNDLLASGAGLLLGGTAIKGPKLTPVDGNPFEDK